MSFGDSFTLYSDSEESSEWSSDSEFENQPTWTDSEMNESDKIVFKSRYFRRICSEQLGEEATASIFSAVFTVKDVNKSLKWFVQVFFDKLFNFSEKNVEGTKVIAILLS